MKRKCICLILFISLLMTLANANAYCETYNHTGKHANTPYISSVHTSSGHEYGYICQDCGHITVSGYKQLTSCCLCTGHNYVFVSKGPHTSQGHKVTQKCTKCSKTITHYETDSGCCDCVGHVNGPKQVDSYHTPGLGHYYTVKCKQCDKITESGYTTYSSCSICNCNHVYITDISDVHEYGKGHAYTKYCCKCNRVEESGYTSKSGCCECRGYHNFTYSVSPTHTSSGHLETAKCSTCGYTTSYYVILSSCCECTGNHNYKYTVSSEHTDKGHLETARCSVCGHTKTSYVSVANCCKCTGQHVFGSWSAVSSQHEESGHRQSRVCTKCGYKEIKYSTYRPCCQCHGHDMQKTSNIGPHTMYGHETVYRCITCGYEERIYEDVFGCPLCSNTPTNQDEFIEWAQHVDIPYKSITGKYTLSYAMYRDYGYFVYGGPHLVDVNPCVMGEYQFLGFAFDEQLFTNISFQNTQMGSVNANDWIYENIAGAWESWERLERFIQKPYMLNTPLIGHGAQNFCASEIGMEKTRVQSGASWTSTGSVYTYKTNGFYATFKIPEMGAPDVTLNASFSKDTLLFEPGDVYKQGFINVSFTVDKPVYEIEYIKIYAQNGQSVTLGRNDTGCTLSIDVPKSPVMPAKFTVRVLIEIKSIFNDIYIKGEYCSVDLKNVDNHNNTTPSGGEDPTNPDPENYEDLDIPDNNDTENYDILIHPISVIGSWNRWGNNERFTCLEQIELSLIVTGRVTGFEVLFHDDLKEKSFTDAAGNVYDFAYFSIDYEMCPDDIDERGIWPDGMSEKYKFIIPLCNSTIDYDDTRLRIPYWIKIRVYNEEKCVERTYYLDITGNVYDWLYVMP